MNLTQGPAAARPNLIGIGIVALLHVLLGYALVSGLARKVVEVIKAPLETHLIEEFKPPPPPPPPPQQTPAPKLAPPPAFVPPPEVTPPPQPQPTITTTHAEPPPAPVTIAAAAPAVEAPPAPPAPPRAAVPARIDVASCEKPEYPAAALRADTTGVTKIRFAIDAEGRVVRADLESASGGSREHRLLDRSAVEALSRCRFKPGTDEAGMAVGSTAVVSYVWKTD
jgi:protein TonB